MNRRVLIAVTHLLGAGHLTRAAALGRAFARAGNAVTLVSGGMPAPLAGTEGLQVVQLPPVRVEGTAFGRLLDAAGRPAGADVLAARRGRMAEAVAAARPDILVTELFPFGRRVLAGEFAALLVAARRLAPRPVVAASIRDVLVASSKPERIAQTHRLLAEHYDVVLVHGDPDLVRLEASWPIDGGLSRLARYTGYVDEGAPVAPAPNRQGILVSGGSSAAALPLLRAAIGASRRLSEMPWRLLAGPGIPEEELSALRQAAPAHVVVERARPDFRQLLAQAALSISQSGYNTAVDLLRTRTPAVLVPFEEAGETEQRLRAERLAARGLARVLPEADLSAERLAGAASAALAAPAPEPWTPRLDGAERSVAILLGIRDGPTAAGPARRNGLPRTDWTPVREAFGRARDMGYEPRFWWRDDDAVADTPALRRLLALGQAQGSPVAVAAVPALLEDSLGPALREAGVAALVHGLAHANHSVPGAKKAEFGNGRPLEALAKGAEAGLALLQHALGEAALPVFVPPWNRIDPGLVWRLPALGYAGLSTFGDRARAADAPGIARVNAHLDPIDWHGTRGLADRDGLAARLAAAIERRATGAADPEEAIGLLTHHLVHDEEVWTFCADLLEELTRNSAAFALAHALFCVRQPDRRGWSRVDR